MSDNLESYFKKQLSDESSGNDNWNVPSDAVWEKTLPKIQKRKGIFIPWRYLYILGAALFIVLGLLLFKPEYPNNDVKTSQSITQNKSEDTSQKNDIDEKEEVSSKFESNNEEKQIGSGTNNESPAEKKKFQGDKNPLKQQNAKPSIINNTNKTKPSIARNTETQNEAMPKKPGPLREKANKKNVETIEPNPVLATIKANETGPTKEMVVDSSFTSVPGRPDINPTHNRGKLGFGIYFLPTYNSTYLSGDMGNSPMETKNTYLYSGNYGFEIKYYLTGRLAIAGGIQRSETRSWSKSRTGFGYDPSTEITMENGEKENTSDIPLQTPFGQINTRVTYRFPGSANLPEGELMETEFETKQQITYLSIPLGVEYNIFPLKQINWFAEGGVSYNQELKNGTNFSSSVIHDGNAMKVVGEDMMDKPDFTDKYLGFYLGTGLNYRLSNSFQLTASARYFNNLTKLNQQENIATHLHGFSLKIGMVYFY